MALVQKNLPAVNDTIELTLPSQEEGQIGCEMRAGGAGTVVLEATFASDPAAGDWFGLKVMNATTEIAADNIAAPGIVYAFNPGYKKVRARKTVGVAACNIILSTNQ